MKKCVMIALSLIVMAGCRECVIEEVGKTELVVVNGDTTDVLVYLTLGGGYDSMWVQDVRGIFGIKDSGLVGSFVLGAGDSLRYSPTGAISGQFCFNGQAYQCLGDSLYTGSTLTEFCLNNAGTVKNAQETVDISCVAGVSYLASMDMIGGGIWTANYVGFDSVSHIENSIFGRNANRVGVYPVGCDDCDSSVAPPKCVVPETPSKCAICQVQRDAKRAGGVVIVKYISKPYQICK